jgi:hypothetical protein
MRDFPSPVLRGTFTARELGVCRNDALEMVEAHAVFPGGPRPSLVRRFRFTTQADARAYLETLRSEHPKAVLTQGENKLLVRIRNRGHADVTFKATSYAETEQAILRIESERRVGLFIDYSRAQKTTLARLPRRRKGASNELS